MITFKDTQIEKKMSALRCVDSQVTRQVVGEMLNKVMKGSGWDGDVEFDFTISDWQPGKFTDTVWISGNQYYDWLMDNKETSIDDKISARILKKMTFVSHDFAEFTLTVIVSCDLPEEDFKTLDMLGKVHREYKPGHMSESIFCAI